MRWLDGAEIGRNDACRCGSGRKVKNCCINLLRDFQRPLLVDYLPEMATYVSATDLWPEPVNEDAVLAFFRDFDGIDVVQTLSKFGVILQGPSQSAGDSAELELLNLIMPQVWFTKIQLWLRSGKRQTALHRLLILATIRMSMISDRADSPKVLKGNEHGIGPALLGFSAMLEADITNLLRTATTTPEKSAVLAASFYRNAFYDHVENHGTELGRHWALLIRAQVAVATRYPREAYDFTGRFEQLLGYSVVIRMGIAVAVHHYYQRPLDEILGDPQKFLLAEGYLTGLSAKIRSQAYQAMKGLALTWDEHVAAMKKLGKSDGDNKLQFLTLHSKPLVETSGRGFFPLDTEFVWQQSTDGVYWELLAALRAAGFSNEIGRLRVHFGRCVEWYVAEILRPDNQQDLKTTWLDWDADFEASAGASVPDAAVYQDGVIYLIEVTTSAVTPADAISGDPALLRAALQRVWFEGHGRRPGKLRQLQSAVQAFERGSLQLKRLDGRPVRRVIPVFVSLRPLPQFPILSTWYCQIMSDNGLTEPFIRDLTFMDLRDVEAVATGDQGIDWRIIERKLNVARTTSVSNFMIFGLGINAMRRHSKVYDWMYESFDVIESTLFG